MFHDALIGDEILLFAPKAEKIAVGKRCGRHSTAQQFINKRLLDAARRYQVVVRLKGGDPMLFGRAHEEIAFLREKRHPSRSRPRCHRGARRERRARRIADATAGRAQCRLRNAPYRRRLSAVRLGEGGCCSRYCHPLHGSRRGAVSQGRSAPRRLTRRNSRGRRRKCLPAREALEQRHLRRLASASGVRRGRTDASAGRRRVSGGVHHPGFSSKDVRHSRVGLQVVQRCHCLACQIGTSCWHVRCSHAQGTDGRDDGDSRRL